MGLSARQCQSFCGKFIAGQAPQKRYPKTEVIQIHPDHFPRPFAKLSPNEKIDGEN